MWAQWLLSHRPRQTLLPSPEVTKGNKDGGMWGSPRGRRQAKHLTRVLDAHMGPATVVLAQVTAQNGVPASQPPLWQQGRLTPWGGSPWLFQVPHSTVHMSALQGEEAKIQRGLRPSPKGWSETQETPQFTPPPLHVTPLLPLLCPSY